MSSPILPVLEIAPEEREALLGWIRRPERPRRWRCGPGSFSLASRGKTMSK